jgi:sec-independent protein translocase protein TatC
MSFLDHLDELRRRLIWAIGSVGVGFVIALVFIDRIFAFIMKPLAATLPPGGKMVYTEPTEAFMLQLKVAALAGLLLAAPLVMMQLWLFIAPGLYKREKRMALPFVISSSLLFLSGAAFNHFVVFPIAFAFLGSFRTDYMEFLPRISPAFSLYAHLALAFGLIFQMPVLVFTLARLGLVTAGFLWRNTKYAVLIIFIVSALITPTSDVVTQTLMAAPMMLLYLVSIVIALLFGKKRTAAAD